MRAVEYCQQLVIALRSEALWKSGNFGFEISLPMLVIRNYVLEP